MSVMALAIELFPFTYLMYSDELLGFQYFVCSPAMRRTRTGSRYVHLSRGKGFQMLSFSIPLTSLSEAGVPLLQSCSSYSHFSCYSVFKTYLYKQCTTTIADTVFFLLPAVPPPPPPHTHSSPLLSFCPGAPMRV